MQARLLFITSHYFRQPTVDALARLNFPCETQVVPYDDFAHIATLYGELAPQFDACFVSGVVAQQAIEMVHTNITKPLVPFQVSSNGLHRQILQLAVETGKTDFSRIAVDFLVALGNDYSVTDFLKIECLDDVYSSNSMKTIQIGTGNGYTIETQVLNRIVSLWEQKAIDLVICQYSSIVPELEKREIPCRCPFLSDQSLGRIIQDTLTKLELKQLQENHPVIIQVFPKANTPLTEAQSLQLGDAIQKFVKANLLDCVVQNTGSCSTLITSLQVLRFLTQEFQVCRFSSFLEAELDFPVLVGYGVGTTVPHAMNNVQTASREAKLTGKAFIVDSRGCLIGPLNSENRIVLSTSSLPNVSELAKCCNLSAMTIQKIITILQNTGSDKLTIPELAARLDTTIRNANRIMLNLCKGGLAAPVYTQPTHSRGRPIQVYHLDLIRRS